MVGATLQNSSAADNGAQPRLLIATSYPMDEPVIRNRLSPLIARALARGLEVVLYSIGDVEFDEQGKGFVHHPLGIRARSRRNFVLRALDEWRMSGAILRAVDWQPRDVVMLTIPSIFLMFRARLLDRARKILDVRDLTWEYLPDRRPLARIAKKLFRVMACRAVADFAMISCSNAAERAYVRNNLGYVGGDIVALANGVAQAQFDALALSDCSFDESRALPPTVSYIGNVGVAQNLTELLNAARMLPHVHFIIAGGGTCFEEVRAARDAMGLTNVEMTGRIPWDDVLGIYARSDILYAQLLRGFDSAMPSKLYEYLATGKCLIYGGDGLAARNLADYENCHLIEPSDPLLLKEAIEAVLTIGAHLRTSTANRERIAAEHIRERSIDDFLSSVEQLTDTQLIR